MHPQMQTETHTELSTYSDIAVSETDLLVRCGFTRHPLIAFFVLAFAGAWLALLPLLLDTHGFGLVPLTFPDVVCFLLAGLAGPTLASFVMTAVTSGKAGVRHLLHRYVLWRIGLHWYLLVLFGLPIVLLLGKSALLGPTPLSALMQKWPLVFTSYLPLVAIIVAFAQLLEEPVTNT